MKTPDPYSILGIGRNASNDAIKNRYRELARKHHPDSRPGDSDAENRFKEISRAYAILGNQENRRRFDAGEIDMDGNEKTRTSRSGGGFGAGASGFSGFGGNKTGTKSRFDRFFRERDMKSSIRARGANVNYTLKISFLEAALGADKTISMAGGKKLKVAIPAGTNDGQTLRLKGQGMKGSGGGGDGDALVEITTSPDPVFSRNGPDIHSELAVSIDEAVMGGKIEGETIHGIVSISVPENSNSGTRLRLKGRGIKAPGQEAGDHYVTLKVVLPEKTDKSFMDFIRTWVRANPYNPRRAKPGAAASGETKMKAAG